MESQEKISRLINQVHDYTATIKQTVFNDKPLSDDQVLNYFDIKEKCLQALFDIVLLTKSSKIASDTSNKLSNLLYDVTLPAQLSRNTLQQAIAVCDVLKKNLVVDDVVHKAKEEKAALFQSELIPLKKMFGFSDTFILEKSTSKFFFDDSVYEAMNVKHIQSIVDEVSRIQKYFLRGQRRKSDLPIWFLKFIYALNDFVVKNHRKAQTKNYASHSLSSKFEFGEKKKPILVDFDASYKHMENFLLCESYISARDLCQDMITSFPNHERISDLKKKLEEIQGYIEKLKQMLGDTNIHTPKQMPMQKKVDPRCIDPKTGRIKDDFE